MNLQSSSVNEEGIGETNSSSVLQDSLSQSIGQDDAISGQEIRKIFANEINPQYPKNRISNTKYTLLTFLPKNLFEQFGEFYNLYFLIIALLQLNATITPVDPISTWLPLIFVFTVSAIKEGFDDYKRRQMDNKANKAFVSVIEKSRPYLKHSEDIRVGDVIYLTAESEVPCDIVLLATSEEDGSCYIQTTNLDGESDFKLRNVADSTLSMTEAKGFQGIIECEPPNERIYEFNGRMKKNLSAAATPLDSANLILQGSHIRNTAWLYGVAIYTGNETKLGKNKKKTGTKRTKQDRFIHFASLFIFIFQLVLTIVFGTIGVIWQINYAPEIFYLDTDGPKTFIEFLVVPLRFLLLNSMMIPISLKVTLDVIKYMYARFIEWDIHFYDSETDQPALASSAKVAEDLGQIQVICTDKTGTLTQNSMTFSRCAIGDTLYSMPTIQGDTDHLLNSAQSGNLQTMEFLISMAICNSVKAFQDEDEQIVYRASSPDEEALVHAAAARGVTLLHTDNKRIDVNIQSKTINFEKGAILAFNSNRKRMSVVVRHPNGQLTLYCKGGDDVMRERCGSSFTLALQSALREFAGQGLRTLCFAKKEISNHFFETWLTKFQKAASSMNRREEKVEKVYNLLESDLTMMGITAIEDKLQEHLAQTIQTLREAQILIWVLTGDRADTATQTAVNCNLIETSQEIFQLKGTAPLEILASIKELSHKVENMEKKPALVVLGSQLAAALQDPDFADLCLTRIGCLVCARTTPSQKAQVVQLLTSRQVTCAAIGDGGNDVAMIQSANVGIGIVGKEGLQASRAADYAISKFEFLSRLILVHGRYANRRTAFVVQYSFYKSMLICFNQIFYQFFTGFSGSSFFDTFSLTFYNILFTGLPPIAYALDKDLPESYLLAHPVYYCETQNGGLLTRKSFSLWLLRAFVQSLVVFLLTVYLGGSIIFTGVPIQIDHTALSFVSYTTLILINTFTVYLESKYVTVVNHSAILGSCLAYFLSMLLLNFMSSKPEFGVIPYLWSSLQFWTLVIMETFVCLAPVIVFRTYFSKSKDQKIEASAIDPPWLQKEAHFAPFASTRFSDVSQTTSESSSSSYRTYLSERFNDSQRLLSRPAQLPLNDFSFSKMENFGE